MGRVYLHTLGDCSRKGALLAIKCGACERVVYLAPDRLIGLTIGSRRVTGGEHLREIELTPGCGLKRAGIRAVWEHEIPGIPKGIPPMVFLNADERERKRMIRKVRG